MARPGQKPLSNKTNYQTQPSIPANQKKNADEANWSINKGNQPLQGGVSFNAAVPYDDEYIMTTPHTQSGEINFTKGTGPTDPASTGAGNGDLYLITSDGNDWNFTTDFSRISGLTVENGAVTPVNGTTYRLIFLYNGTNFEVGIKDVQINTGDITAPSLSTATVEFAEPTKIVLTYDESLDESSVPDTSDYTPSGGKTVTNVAVSTTTVTLTCNSAYIHSDTVTISYTAGANPIQDAAGNDAANLSGEAVTNNITAPPTIISFTIENATDSVLDIVASEAINITTAGWNIDTDGAALSISSVSSGSGTTTPKLQLSRSVLGTETLNVDYNPATGNTVATASPNVELETITDEAVANNITDSNLLAEWDASDDSSVTTANGSVTLWEDQTTNNEDLAESTDTPVHSSAGDTVSFTGVSTTSHDILSKIIAAFEFQQSDDFTIFIENLIFDSAGTGTAQHPVNDKISSSNNSGWSINTSADGLTLFFSHHDNSTQNFASWAPGGGFIDDASRNIIFINESGTLKIYDATNTNVGSNGTTSIGTITYGAAKFKIGVRDPVSSSAPFKGSIKKVKVWDKALNAGERDTELGI